MERDRHGRRWDADFRYNSNGNLLQMATPPRHSAQCDGFVTQRPHSRALHLS